MKRLPFRLQLFLRLLLMIGLTAGLVTLLLSTQLFAISLIVFLLLAVQLGELIQFLHRTNRDLTAFLEGIRVDDYSTSYERRQISGAYGPLYQQIQQIRTDFQQIRTEKEMQYQYLQTLVEHVEVGLLCYDEEGGIVLMNKALQRMLQQPYLPHLKSLTHRQPELLRSLQALNPGREALQKVIVGEDRLQLSLRATRFKLLEKEYFLVSLQDISRELETRELEAWQQLIRILTHEIMNSATPLSSLSETLLELWKEESAWEEAEVRQDTKEGLAAIHARARGLIHFTQTYRSLTQVPQPDWQPILISDYLQQIITLMAPKVAAQSVVLQLETVSAELRADFDPRLMEQVLINLIQNACDALEGQENGEIALRARNKSGKLLIEVSDNGPGISQEEQEQVFVPFFTTKTQGSGIGLSLARQIVHAHNGSLALRSQPGMGATVSILL